MRIRDLYNFSRMLVKIHQGWLTLQICKLCIYVVTLKCKMRFWYVYKHGYTADDFIFVGTNFRVLNESDTFVGFKIRGHSIFLHNSYRKSLIRWYWNSWIRPGLHEYHENLYPRKDKQSTVSFEFDWHQKIKVPYDGPRYVVKVP